MDFTELLGAIALGTVSAAVLSAAGIKIVPIVAKWGAAKVLSMFGR